MAPVDGLEIVAEAVVGQALQPFDHFPDKAVAAHVSVEWGRVGLYFMAAPQY
ncbi:hypothetical protein ACR2R6_02725 [Methylocaldum gracile subsp. desertum]|uniref:hypothetical protein n=1 Tax=Methylocaldum sp. GT1BW TaxID=3438964 RepID=UPI003DA0C00F